MNSVPMITPIKCKEFTSQQSKYDVVGKLPLRDIILGPSGAGKSTVVDLILGLLLTVAMTCVDHQTASYVDCG